MTNNTALSCWNSALSVDIAEIDKQHQTLCRLIDDIRRAIHSDKDHSFLDDLMGQLGNYVSIHFSIEESLMRNLNYPDYDSHKKSHERLLDECAEMRHQIQSGRMTRLQLLDHLDTWFSNHILNEDKGYSDHLQNAGVADALKNMDWMSPLWKWHPNP